MKIEQALVVVNTVAELFDLMSGLSEDEQKAVLELINQLTDDPTMDQIKEEVHELLNSGPDEEFMGDLGPDVPMESNIAASDEDTKTLDRIIDNNDFTTRTLKELRGFRQAQVYNVLVTAARVSGYRYFFSATEIGEMVYTRYDDMDHIITHSTPSALVADPLYTLQHLSLVEADGEPSSRDRRYRLADHVSLNVDATFANTEINSACGRRII